jgi:hypothetical protein
VIVTVVDAIRDLVPLPAGITADLAATEPTKVQPGRFYAWPRRISPHQLNLQGEAEGFFEASVLRVRLLWTLSARGEPRAKQADRTISEQLDAAAMAIITALAPHEHAGKNPLWWSVVIENVLPDVVRTFEVRGVGVDVAVRLNAPYGPAGSGDGTSGGGS